MTSMTQAEWHARLEGFDPFDALRGRWVPRWMRRCPRTRQAIIQLRKRSPYDLSGILGVEPFVMAKTVACFLTSESRRAASERAATHLEPLVGVLRATEGNLGSGRWGYEFDVQTRWAFYPKGSQNLIAMVFCGRAMATAGLVAGDGSWVEELHAAADRLMDQHLSPGGVPFFRYVTDSTRLIHNANVLGAGLVAASGVLRDDSNLVDAAMSAAMVTVEAQHADGSWAYGEGHGVGWSDSFHTAYVLDGLLLLWLATGDDRLESTIRNGARAWLNSFFGSDGEPWYTPAHHFPYDIHSASTAVDVGLRLAGWGLCDPDVPMSVASWSERNLVDRETGVTIAGVRSGGPDRRHFVRWGDAHWALAASALYLRDSGRHDPLEQAVHSASRARRGVQ